MKKRIFREKLEFKSAEFRGSVDLGMSGINLATATPAVVHHKYEDFDTKGFQFGSLWGSLNDPKYYENATANNIMPKEEDFIEVPFRLLSATTVGAGTWKATDFSNTKVLKASAGKLVGKPIYKDHETDLDNWVGVVKGTKWVAETTEGTQKIPAGIDGLMLIDAKTNPKTARGLLLGSIFSNSVTVDFAWEMSHSFENEWDFYDKVGTMHEDGKMIRRIVNEVYDYYESSLVWLGADPFAKARDADGNLVNVDTHGVYEYSKATGLQEASKVTYADLQDNEKEEFKNSKKIKINFALEKNIISLRHKDDSQENQNEMKNEFLLAFIAAFGTSMGLTKDTPEAEAIEKLKTMSLMTEENKNALQLGTAFVNAAQAFLGEGQVVTAEFVKENSFVSNTQLEAYKKAETDLEAANTSITTLKNEKTALEPNAKLGQEYSKKKLSEAKRVYTAFVGADKVDATVIGLFDKAKPEELEGLLKSYVKGATEKFSGKCASCGSAEFKFQSSFTDDDDNVPQTVNHVVTADDFRSESRSAFTIGRNREED